MDKIRDRKALKIGIAVLFAVVFPVALRFILKSDFSLEFILVLVLLKMGLSILAFVFNGNVRRIFSILSTVYTIGFGIVLTAGIIITPVYAYQQLFALISTQQLVSTRIAVIFILFISFFSSSFAGLIMSSDWVWPFLGMLLVSAVMALLLFYSTAMIILTLVALLFCIVYLAFKFLDKGSRRQSIIFSILIICLTALGGYGLYSLIRPSGSEVIEQISTNLRPLVSALFPRFNLVMMLPEFGYSFERKEADDTNYMLGETPILSPLSALEVEATRGELVVYLRTMVNAKYENNGWSPSGIPPAVEDPQLFTSIKNRALEEGELRIRILLEYFNYLPYTLNTTGFELVTGEIPPEKQGDLNRGFYFNSEKPLIYGTSYILKQAETSTELSAFERELYTDMPFYTERIKTLAGGFADPAGPEAVLENIKTYLAENYKYNLHTTAAEGAINFLENFLFESREGYSVHFATALAILARLNDIPARYVSGFFVRIPDPDAESGLVKFEGYKKRVSGLDTHAWVEVFLEGRGWITVEPTPVFDFSHYTVAGEGLRYNKNIDMNLMTRRQVANILGKDVFSAETAPVAKKTIKVPLALIIIPLVAALLVLLFLYQYHTILYMLRKDKKTYLHLSRKLVKKQLKYGVPAPAETGWLQWGQTLALAQPASAQRVNEYVQQMILIVYGGVAVDKQVVVNAFSFYKKVGSKRSKLPTEYPGAGTRE